MICTACGGTTFDIEGVCLRCGTPAVASTVATLESAAPGAQMDEAAMPAAIASLPDPPVAPEPMPSTAPRNPPTIVPAIEDAALAPPASTSTIATPPVALPLVERAATTPGDDTAAVTPPPHVADLPEMAAPEPTPAPRRTSMSVPIAAPEDPSSTNPSRGTYCGRCGSAVDPAADFCGICGNPMNEAAMQRVRAARTVPPNMPAVGGSSVMAVPLHPLHGPAPSTPMRWLIIMAVAAIVIIGLVVGLLLTQHL